MKLGLAVLPLEVWADIFLSPWFTRQELAQIADNIGNYGFTERLQKLLHDCGKQTLPNLLISFKRADKLKQNPSKYQLRKRAAPRCQASLAVAPLGYYWFNSTYKECEFPETKMPNNIKKFNQLSIDHFDNDVLEFLNKIKPLFTNVLLDMSLIDDESATKNARILLDHLLPMLASIRGINCTNKCMEFLEEEFPGTLALAKELDFGYFHNQAYIPTYLNWLSTPQDFHVHGPRFLKMAAYSNAIVAMVDAVREHFLAATTPSTFVILIYYRTVQWMQQLPANEFTIENAATNEKLSVRNAIFQKPMNGTDMHYAEIVRHPTGADAQIREWIKQRAYYEKDYSSEIDGLGQYDKEEQTIKIGRMATNNKDLAYQQEFDEDGDENKPCCSKAIKKRAKWE